MIIANGTIEIKKKVAGGIDPNTGFPSKPTQVEWSDPIECQYTANKYDKLGKVSGESFTIAAYSILIEENTQDFEAEQVRLKNKRGKTLGEYSVISIEPLEAVGQMRILI